MKSLFISLYDVITFSKYTLQFKQKPETKEETSTNVVASPL